jgi:hypothetical protein
MLTYDSLFVNSFVECGMRNVLDILIFFFSDRIYPAMRGGRQRDLRHSYGGQVLHNTGGQVLHNTGGQVRFTTTPFMTGFPLRSNTQIYMDCRDVFPVFLIGQGLCWKLVAGPAWIAISPVLSLMVSSSTDQLPFLKRMQACPPIKSAFTLCSDLVI